jgi:hypothetical protein
MKKKRKEKSIVPILHSHFLTRIVFLKLLLFFNHIFFVFLTMEPSQ